MVSLYDGIRHAPRASERAFQPPAPSLEALLPAAGAATALWLMGACLLFLV